jgi:hypothetical protein
MEFDNFFDDYESAPIGSTSGCGFLNDQDGAEDGLDPFDLDNPVAAYFFLSDDAQDELGNPLNQKLKCQLCGHKFLGRKIDQCPKCYGSVFREMR